LHFYFSKTSVRPPVAARFLFSCTPLEPFPKSKRFPQLSGFCQPCSTLPNLNFSPLSPPQHQYRVTLYALLFSCVFSLLTPPSGRFYMVSSPRRVVTVISRFFSTLFLPFCVKYSLGVGFFTVVLLVTWIPFSPALPPPFFAIGPPIPPLKVLLRYFDPSIQCPKPVRFLPQSLWGDESPTRITATLPGFHFFWSTSFLTPFQPLLRPHVFR